MEHFWGILGLVFLYTAFGAVWKVVNHEWCLTEKAKRETGFTSMLLLVFSCIILSHLLSLNWYWSVLINFIAIVPIGKISISIYIFFIGLLSYKRKIRFQIDELSLSTDGAILFNIGTILFIVFICI